MRMIDCEILNRMSASDYFRWCLYWRTYGKLNNPDRGIEPVGKTIYRTWKETKAKKWAKLTKDMTENERQKFWETDWQTM